MKPKNFFSSLFKKSKSLPKGFKNLPKKYKVLVSLVLLVAIISVFAGIKSEKKQCRDFFRRD